MIGSGRSIRGAPRGGSTPSPQNNAPRGTPSAAAQNAFRGILRIVTPVVNLINRVVQGVTGGRGGIAQLARGLTGLVNQAYQRATGQAWGAQSGTGGAGAGDGASEDDTPALPPPPPTPDIGESDDRLRALNEDDEETRPFNWQEFFGDDFTVEDIGDSMRESAEWFLRFVRGEVDDEVPLLTQIRTLFDEARGRPGGEAEPSPVDENWTSLTTETLDARFGEGWIEYIVDDENEAQALITYIKYEARDIFGLDLASDLRDLTAQQAVALYVSRLESRLEDPDSDPEYTFWRSVQNSFGVPHDVTMDVSEFAIYELGLPLTTTPAEADAEIDRLIQDYIDSGLIDSEAAQGMTREQIAYTYYEAALAQLTASQREQRALWQTGTIRPLTSPFSIEVIGNVTAYSALREREAQDDALNVQIAALQREVEQSQNLVLAFNRMYEPDRPPYVELLLTVLGFTALDKIVSGVDLVRSVINRDLVGAVFAAVDFLIPGRSRSVGDAVSSNVDTASSIIGRTDFDADLQFYTSFPQPRPILVDFTHPLYGVAQEIRSQPYLSRWMSNVPGQESNIGVLNYTIDGRSGSLWAMSGGASKDMAAERAASALGTSYDGVRFVTNAQDRLFDTKVVRGFDRAVDSEAKLLEGIARELGLNRNSSGTITLYTDRYPCLSCGGAFGYDRDSVIGQFMQRFPGIEVTVVYAIRE